MKIETKKEDDKTIVYVEGRLDTNTSEEFEKELRSLIKENAEILINLEKLEYISSAGLRVLLYAHKTLTEGSGNLIIEKPNTQVKEVFDVTGFTQILNIN